MNNHDKTGLTAMFITVASLLAAILAVLEEIAIAINHLH